MTDDIRRVDPGVAHHVDARTILTLVPHLDQGDLPEIRMLLARRIQTGSRQHARFTTWQDAWNDLTGATEHRPGVLEYTPTRCKTCHGRKFDRRTGTICHECMGRGRPRRAERMPARFAPPPTPTAPPTEPVT